MMKVKLMTVIVVALAVPTVSLASGEHGAATAGPTAGGDNTSAPTSTHKGGFHFKHKKKAPKTTSPAPAS